MKEKIQAYLRKPAVLGLLAVELLVVAFALAAALHPAAAYTFTADQWESIAQESKIDYDEDGRIGVTEMTDGEDILQTPPMTLPKGHYTVTLDYRYVPSVWEGGVERRSCLYFTSAEAGTVTGEKPCIDVKKQQDTLTLNVSDDSETVRLVAHNDGGIFTLGTVRIEQDMLYAGACVAGWLVLFVLLDAFLLLTVPGSPVRLADSELCACLWVLCAVAVLTCAPALTNGGAANGADWSFHLSRIEGIANGLREGQFPVRVYSMAKDGYGYAPSLFYGELLLYFPAVLRLLGMSVQGAYHTYLLAVQLLTAGVAFFSLRQIFKQNKTALVGSALYMLSTYHLYKIYWLSAVGEYTAMAFLPLIPAALYELYDKKPLTRRRARKACAELVVGFGMLLQVHLLSLEMTVLATAVFCLLHLHRTFTKPVLLTWLKAAALTVLLNLWFLLPFLTLMLSGDYNNMYTGSPENGGQIVKNCGLRIAELFGWQKNHNNLGPELLAGGFVLLWCWLTLRERDAQPEGVNRKDIRVGLWAVGFAALACWMSTNTFPWQAVGRIPVVGRILVAIQFPGRYLSLATVLLVLAAACGLSALRRTGYARPVAVLLLGVSVFGAALFFRDQQADTAYLGDGGQLIYSEYKKFNIGWYFDGLYLPDGAHETQNGYESTVPVTTVEVTSIEQADGITTLTCAETTGQNQHAELPLLYYLGYTVIEGPGTAFKTANGLVGVTVPANYTGTIRVTYREPKRWLAADVVSLVTLVGVLLIIRRKKCKGKRKDQPEKG